MSDSKSQPRHWVIIPAAGVGKRMQADRPKQYLPLDGLTVLDRTLKCFIDEGLFAGVYLGLSEADTYWPASPYLDHDRIRVFAGGLERADTVLNGLKALENVADSHDWIWVHDAARPCLRREDIGALAEAITGSASQTGALLAVPVHDTVKRAKGQSVLHTESREGLWRALTPQVFQYQHLKNALEEATLKGLAVTDESSAIEHAGLQPQLVVAKGSNLKITRPGDLEQAMKELNSGNHFPVPRIGNGFDVHAFEPGSGVMLGGVKIAHDQALRAHSDGDVLLHALMDAMLGALALGDIGHHFPDTDEAWRGADSRKLLVAVNELIKQRGYSVANLDVTVMAERPKLAPHINEMRACIAGDLGLSIDVVSVKATTTEKLGFVGRREGIACQASVLLLPDAEV